MNAQHLIDYSTTLFNRNLKVFNQKIYSPEDFVTEANFIGFDTDEEAQKIIRNRIIHTKRVILAQLQELNDSTFNKESKVCRKCNEEKDISEFKERTDKHTGFRYYTSYCIKCERKRRRDSYANSEQQKKSNRERQKRWRDRNKKS